jgi:hypothetical protein
MEALTNHTTVIPELNFISLLKGLYAIYNNIFRFQSTVIWQYYQTWIFRFQSTLENTVITVIWQYYQTWTLKLKQGLICGLFFVKNGSEEYTKVG